MVSLVVHAILGLVLIGLIVASNPTIFARPAGGPRLSALECAYYAIGIAGTVLGYYFNTRFVAECNGHGQRLLGARQLGRIHQPGVHESSRE